MKCVQVKRRLGRVLLTAQQFNVVAGKAAAPHPLLQNAVQIVSSLLEHLPQVLAILYHKPIERTLREQMNFDKLS